MRPWRSPSKLAQGCLGGTGRSRGPGLLCRPIRSPGRPREAEEGRTWANGRRGGVPAYVAVAPLAPAAFLRVWGPTPGPRTARLHDDKEVV